MRPCCLRLLDVDPPLACVPRNGRRTDWRLGCAEAEFFAHAGVEGRIFLLYLLGAALNWILSFAFTIPLLFVMSLVPSANSPQHAETAGTILLVVVYGGAFAVQAFTRPVYGIALVLFYYDQRIRQEAFDIEWMMLKAGLVVPAHPQPEAQPC